MDGLPNPVLQEHGNVIVNMEKGIILTACYVRIHPLGISILNNIIITIVRLMTIGVYAVGIINS